MYAISINFMRSTRDFMQIPVRVPSWAGTPATAKKLKIVRDRFRHLVLQFYGILADLPPPEHQ